MLNVVEGFWEDHMIRALVACAFALAVVIGSNSASHAAIVVEPGGSASGVVAAPMGSVGTAEFELGNPGTVTVVDVLSDGSSFLSLTGTGDPVNTAPISSVVETGALGAFANTIDLDAGSYTFTLVGQPMALATFTVSEVPLPAGAVLFGTAMVGLAAYRRLRAAKA